MMTDEIGAGVVCVILVVANRDGKIGIGMKSQGANQVFKKNPPNLRRFLEICVVANRVSDLRQRQQVFAGQIAACTWRQPVDITSDLKVGRRGSLIMRFENGLGIVSRLGPG